MTVSLPGRAVVYFSGFESLKTCNIYIIIYVIYIYI